MATFWLVLRSAECNTNEMLLLSKCMRSGPTGLSEECSKRESTLAQSCEMYRVHVHQCYMTDDFDVDKKTKKKPKTQSLILHSF